MHALLLVAMMLSPQTYDEALKEHQDTGKPLAILCHADYCEPCRRMQAEMKNVRNGNLVAYGEVDAENDPVFHQIKDGGGSIPQLVIYYRQNGQYYKVAYHGFKSARQIEEIFHDAHLQSVHKGD